MNRTTLIGALWLFLGVPAHAGSLLEHINNVINGNYVVTATLAIYDSNDNLLDQQQMDGASLFTNGFVNTGSSIEFQGAITFPELFPTSPGGSGYAATLHDIGVSLSPSPSYNDQVDVVLDWFGGSYSISHDWEMVHGDDFVNGIAYYLYGESYYPGPTGEPVGSVHRANFGLTFASGVAPVPLPAAVWLFGSGMLGLLGIARRLC